MKRLKKFLVVVILITLSILALLIGQGYKMYKEAISTMPLSQKVESIKSQKDYTSLSEIPKIYTVAVISVEDHRFEKHHGIDVIAIARAAFNDIRTMSFVEGGSTITQQLAKNMYFTQEKKITRKIAEVFMSYEIEKNYSKDEILELYVNTIYYGNNYYNIKSASLGYFDKLPKIWIAVNAQCLQEYQMRLLYTIQKQVQSLQSKGKNKLYKKWLNMEI